MRTLRQMRNWIDLPAEVNGVVADHHCSGRLINTKLTLSGLGVGDTGDNAALAIGIMLMHPAGRFQIVSAYMDVALTHEDAAATSDTPDVGLGTVIASGAVAVLGGTATFEDIITGQTAADCNGTATKAAAVPGVQSTGAVFLNVADTWANVTDTGLTATGTVNLTWVHLDPDE